MKFEHPEWFHVLWVLPVLLLLRWWAEREAAKAAGSLVAKRLREWLVSSASPRRGWSIFVLQLVALAALVTSLARPIYGEEKLEVPEQGKNLMFVIDTSRSMLANDLTPNRLTRAKLAAESILTTLGDYRVGLIAYAGRGYLQAPLTSDHEAVVETIQALDSYTIPKGGSLLSEGIREAREAFKKTKARSHGIILFSDGGDEDPGLDRELTDAKKDNIRILSIGVGTAQGSLIPDPEEPGTDRVILDPSTGQAVHTRLEDKLLKKVAQDTGGMYLTLGAQSLTGTLVNEVMRSIEGMESGKREETKPIQRFYWPLSIGIVLLMLALILRPLSRMPNVSPATAAALTLLALGVGPRADAAVFGGENQELAQAREAYEGQQYQRARDQYARLLNEDVPPEERGALSYGLAASAHQLKDYDRALDNYSQALESEDRSIQELAHRGLGNALYEQGVKAYTQQPEFTVKVWTDSLRHYDSALKINRDNTVVLNRKHVEEQLKKLQEQQEAKKQQQQQKQKGEKGQKGDKGEEGEEDGEPQDGQEKGDKKGDQKEGQQGQDGEQQKDGQQGKEGQEGDKKDQQGQQGQEGEQKDGKGAEPGDKPQEGQGQPLPEGQIQAGAPGENPSGDRERLERMMEEKVMEATGFSRNQARELLRTYSDQMATQFKRRREPSVTKDW